jgi:hypothetical protein
MVKEEEDLLNIDQVFKAITKTVTDAFMFKLLACSSDFSNLWWVDWSPIGTSS